MKYIKNNLLIIPLAIFIFLAGCKKGYLDVNDDPNRVTENNVTPELIFPQAATAVGARTASLNFGFLNNWLGYTSTSGSFAIDQTETTYNIDFSFGDALFQNHYGVLFDLYQTKVKAIAKGDSVLAGAAMILSAKLWQELVDVFGDIPYSQAFQNSTNTRPAYDKAEDIYNSLLKSLDSAKEFMALPARSTFAAIDVVNHGNQSLWIKFANTLKLRLIIRQSEVPGFDPAPEIAKIGTSGSGLNVLHAGENILVNPGYTNETNKQSPFYANYGLTPTGAEANPITRANVYFVNLLSSTSDPRLTRVFKPVTGTTVVGTTYGLAAGNPTSSNASSFGVGLVSSSSQNQWIYPAFESMFLEAEAIARGWVPGNSNAQAAYEAAVRESFVWLGVPDAATAATTYLNTQAIAMWSNAGATPLSKARFIAYQKYIALAGVDPLEAWSDLRRLNMIPDKGYITVNPGKASSSLPVRLLYPQSEYTTNAANVNAEGSINAFTSKIFWQP
jgi:hypothetical protein